MQIQNQLPRTCLTWIFPRATSCTGQKTTPSYMECLPLVQVSNLLLPPCGKLLVVPWLPKAPNQWFVRYKLATHWCFLQPKAHECHHVGGLGAYDRGVMMCCLGYWDRSSVYFFMLSLRPIQNKHRTVIDQNISRMLLFCRLGGCYMWHMRI